MKASAGNAVILLPEAGLERELAARIYAARTHLYTAILDAVVGRPGVRYTELVPLVGKRSRNLVTKALHRLQGEGILTRRGFGREHAGYELTPLGVAVRDAIVEYRALDRLRRDQPNSVATPA